MQPCQQSIWMDRLGFYTKLYAWHFVTRVNQMTMNEVSIYSEMMTDVSIY
jgi:hypothetical protein